MQTLTQSLSVPEAAHVRRSIRAYSPEPIPQASIDTILRETSLAPSAFNLQPWRFVVVADATAKQRLAGAAYQQKQVTAAPVVIAIYSDMADTLAHLGEVTRPGASPEQAAGFGRMIDGYFGTRSETEREEWGHEQGFIALGYLLLTATAHGYATSPMGGFDEAAVKQVLELPANARVVALVAMGRAAEEGVPHHRHELERIVRSI
jgi:nitroreductase